MFTIYSITNMLNRQKVYVGQTVNPSARWRGHRSAARCGDNHPLYNAMRKHGDSNFLFESILEVDTQEQADYQEQIWIILLRAHRSQGGYVVSSDGKGHLGFTDEDAQKRGKSISDAFKKRPGPHHSRRDDVKAEDIFRMYYDEGVSVEDISKTLNCSVDTIRDRMKEAGRPLGRGVHVKTYRQPKVRKDIDADQIKGLYLQGYSAPKIAEQLGCSHSLVRRRLLENEIPLRTSSETWSKMRDLPVPKRQISEEHKNKISVSIKRAWDEGRHTGNMSK